MVKAALDADVLLKGACYGLLVELVHAIPAELGNTGYLGASLFVVRNYLHTAEHLHNRRNAVALLETFAERAVRLEPTPHEAAFAAELEFVAQRANLNLGAGESLLCAIVIARSVQFLVTGDKRAIAALELLFATMPELSELLGKILCLEQLFVRLASAGSAEAIRVAVCREPGVDRALSICFSCSSPEANPDSWLEGLRSYIEGLRQTAQRVLAR